MAQGCAALPWLMAGANVVAASQWPDLRRIDSFVYHANFSLDSNVSLLNEVTQLRKDVPRTLTLDEAVEDIHVYVFQDQRSYRKYLRHYFPGIPYRRALFIKERGPGMVFAYQSDELAIDLRHEATHAVLHSMLPMVPLWLDEGLAEYFEVAVEDRFLDNPHLKRVRWNARLRQVPDLPRLEKARQLSDMKRDDYRDAWAWVHYGLHGPPEVRDEFRSFLQNIQVHIPPGRLYHRLVRRQPRLEQSFAAHFQAMK